MPGRVGGEIIKTMYLYKDIGKGNISIVSVLIEKYMGLSAMVGISFIAFISGYSYIEGTKIAWLIPIISSIFFIASIVFWNVNWGRIKGLGAFYIPFKDYKENKRIIYSGLLLSFLVQLISITEVYLLSIAIGLTVPITYFLIFVPIINAVSAIPVTIAGLGIRETGFAALFHMVFEKLGVTSDQAVSLSMLIFVTMILVNSIGGVEYLRIRKLPEK
jgi:uncharacterized membrane protein YbhN (UPF0104 family)